MKVEFEFSEHRVLIAAACGFVGLFALHAAYPGLFDYWPKSSSELADWVAAIGTVGAIASGFVVASRQHKNQVLIQRAIDLEKDRQSGIRGYWVVMRAAKGARAAFEACIVRLGDHEINWAYIRTMLEECIETLEIKDAENIREMPLLDEIHRMKLVSRTMWHQAGDVDRMEEEFLDGFLEHFEATLSRCEESAKEVYQTAFVKFSEMANFTEMSEFNESSRKLNNLAVKK